MSADPVFIQFGAPAAAHAEYPADVRKRLETDAAQIIAGYPVARSALLPLLHLVQAEDGYITPTGIGFCAEKLGLTPAEVTAVSSFYSMYRRERTGDYLVGVCTNTLCAVMGGDEILADLSEYLGVGVGETTADGTITLEHVECNAACDFAPVVMVNWEFFDNQTPGSGRDLVDALRSGETVTPSRGAPLCKFRDTARILAGFPDERPGASAAAGGASGPSLAGLEVARRRDMQAPPLPHADHAPGSADTAATAARVEADKPAPAPSATVPLNDAPPNPASDKDV